MTTILLSLSKDSNFAQNCLWEAEGSGHCAGCLIVLVREPDQMAWRQKAGLLCPPPTPTIQALWKLPGSDGISSQ